MLVSQGAGWTKDVDKLQWKLYRNANPLPTSPELDGAGGTIESWLASRVKLLFEEPAALFNALDVKDPRRPMIPLRFLIPLHFLITHSTIVSLLFRPTMTGI